MAIKGNGACVAVREMVAPARQGVLVPGDSALGYRLPLGTLPHVPPSQYPYTYITDPSVERGAFPDYHAEAGDALPKTERTREQPVSGPKPTGPTQTIVEQELGTIGGAVRTALSVEPRDGRLCVFMPPVEDAEDYLDLLAAAEATAREMDFPIHIEGLCPTA